MTMPVRGDLVIALDYYDGEVEGFARSNGECTYFLRIAVDADDVNDYAFVPIDCAFFDAIVGLLAPSLVPGKVNVYPGSDERVNRMIDDAVPAMRTQLERAHRKVRGRTYLTSTGLG